MLLRMALTIPLGEEERKMYIIETYSWHYQILFVFCENVTFSHERNKSSFLSKEKQLYSLTVFFLAVQLLGKCNSIGC